MNVTKNASFTGVVSTSAFPGWERPGPPVGHDAHAADLQPEPAHAERDRHLVDRSRRPARRRACTRSGSRATRPVLLDHFYPVGDLDRQRQPRLLDERWRGRGHRRRPAGPARQRDVSTPNNNGTYFGGDGLAEHRGRRGRQRRPADRDRRRHGQPIDDHARQGHDQTATMSVNGGTLGPGVYSLTLRSTGTNSAGQLVTGSPPITVAIATPAPPTNTSTSSASPRSGSPARPMDATRSRATRSRACTPT